MTRSHRPRASAARQRLAGVGLAALLLASCSGGGGDTAADEAPVASPPAASSPPTASADDPFPGAPVGRPIDRLPETAAPPEPGPDTQAPPEPDPVPDPDDEDAQDTGQGPDPEPLTPAGPDPAADAPAGARLCAGADGTAFCVDRATRLFSATGPDGAIAWSFVLPGDNASNDVRDVVAIGGAVYLIAANADGSLERSGFEPGGQFIDTLRLFDALAPAARTFALPRAGRALTVDDGPSGEGSIVVSGTACANGDEAGCRGFVATVDPVDAVTVAYRELGAPTDAGRAAAALPVIAPGGGGDGAETLELTGAADARRWSAASLVDLDAAGPTDPLAGPPRSMFDERGLEASGRWLAGIANGDWLAPLAADVEALVGRIERDVPADPVGTGRPANPVAGALSCDAGAGGAWERENVGTFADRYRLRLDGCPLGPARLSGAIERTRGDGGVRTRGTTTSMAFESVVRTSPDTRIEVGAGATSVQDTVSSGTTGDSANVGSARTVAAASFGRGGATVSIADSAWSANGFSRGANGPFGGPSASQFTEGHVAVTGVSGTWTLGTDGRIGRTRDGGADAPWRPVGDGATRVRMTGPGGAALDAELVAGGAWRYRFGADGGPGASWRIVPGAPGGSFLDALWPD